MRTTLTLEDHLARSLREEAARSGRSFKEVVNDTLRTGLSRRGRIPRAHAYRLEPASLGRVRAGIDLDKALELAARLEDEEIARELELQR